MVVGVVLDITFELGYWMIKHLGYGVSAAVKYMLSSDPPQLAIEASPGDVHGLALSLDAAAQLRRDGVLDDEMWADIVRTTVTRVASDEPTKDDSPVRPETLLLPPSGSPAPTAPPPYAFEKPT